MRLTAHIALLFLLTCAPSLTRAQARTGGSLAPEIERRVSGEISLGAWEPTLARDIVLASLALFASGRVGVWAGDSAGLGTLELDGAVRGYFGEFYDDVGTALYFAMGNARLGLMFGWSDRASFRVRAGPEVVAPIAMANGQRRSVESMTYYGQAALGFWDPWDAFVRGPSVLASGDLDVRDGALLAGAELGIGPSFWVAGDDDGGLVEVPVAVLYYQAAAYVGAQALEWLALGARVQVVGWSDGGGRRRLERRPAEAQASIVPFVRFLARPWHVELRGTLNLGEPEGIGSRSVVWAVRVAAGVELGP